MGAEINDNENRKIEKINENSWLSEEIKKTDRPLARLTKNKEKHKN